MTASAKQLENRLQLMIQAYEKVCAERDDYKERYEEALRRFDGFEEKFREAAHEYDQLVLQFEQLQAKCRAFQAVLSFDTIEKMFQVE